MIECTDTLIAMYNDVTKRVMEIEKELSHATEAFMEKATVSQVACVDFLYDELQEVRKFQDAIAVAKQIAYDNDF